MSEQDSYAIRERKPCSGCGKRRLTTPTRTGALCNECLARLSVQPTEKRP